jgi:excisionase family DNA binding protein
MSASESTSRAASLHGASPASQDARRTTAAPQASDPKLRARWRAVLGGATVLLSLRRVAELLGVSTATVYHLVDRGELQHVRVSNAIRVWPADLAAYIERETGGRL